MTPRRVIHSHEPDGGDALVVKSLNPLAEAVYLTTSPDGSYFTREEWETFVSRVDKLWSDEVVGQRDSVRALRERVNAELRGLLDLKAEVELLSHQVRNEETPKLCPACQLAETLNSRLYHASCKGDCDCTHESLGEVTFQGGGP